LVWFARRAFIVTLLLALLLLQGAVEVSPLFTNDLAGFIKVVAILYGTVMLPLAALVIYFLKRGPDSAISELRHEMNGLGGRVNVVEQAIARQSEQTAATQRMIGEASRDMMQAIVASGDAQLRAVHAVELQVERLKGQSDFGECITQFSKSIERLIERIPPTRDE
jgi:hypothetical protein